MAYIIEHPDKNFTGFFGGVDYYNGIGSTSSILSARLAQEHGHIIRDQKGKRLFIKRTVDRHLKTHEKPVEDEAQPKMSEPEYANRKDRRWREKTKRKMSVL